MLSAPHLGHARPLSPRVCVCVCAFDQLTGPDNIRCMVQRICNGAVRVQYAVDSGSLLSG